MFSPGTQKSKQLKGALWSSFLCKNFYHCWMIFLIDGEKECYPKYYKFDTRLLNKIN